MSNCYYCIKTINVYSHHNGGWTPLYIAAYHDNAECIEQLLLQKNIDVNIQDLHERTPLFHAPEQDHTGLIKVLLSRPSINVTF